MVTHSGLQGGSLTTVQLRQAGNILGATDACLTGEPLRAVLLTQAVELTQGPPANEDEYEQMEQLRLEGPAAVLLWN